MFLVIDWHVNHSVIILRNNVLSWLLSRDASWVLYIQNLILLIQQTFIHFGTVTHFEAETKWSHIFKDIVLNKTIQITHFQK